MERKVLSTVQYVHPDSPRYIGLLRPLVHEKHQNQRICQIVQGCVATMVEPVFLSRQVHLWESKFKLCRMLGSILHFIGRCAKLTMHGY